MKKTRTRDKNDHGKEEGKDNDWYEMEEREHQEASKKRRKPQSKAPVQVKKQPKRTCTGAGTSMGSGWDKVL